MPEDEVAAIVSNIGLHTPISGLLEGITYGSNFGELIIELVPKDQRTRNTDQIIDSLRQQTANISGMEKKPNFVNWKGVHPKDQMLR